MDIAIRVRSYKGAEVWPSQEFVEETQKKRNGREISRVLAARESRADGIPVRYGYMHSQKIGNAIRTIDEWHGNAVFGAIPVGLPHKWGSGGHLHEWVWIVGCLEFLSKVGAKRAVINRAANLQQKVSTPSRPAHLL
jgi:hypothetical protein